MCLNCVKGIVFGLITVLNVTIFFTYKSSSFLNNSGKLREMRVVAWHKGRKGIELSYAIGTFLINDVLNVILSVVFSKTHFSLKKMHLF